MSLWIESPELIDAQSGQILLRFSDSNWSLDHARWLDNETVELSLRKYPGDHHPSSFNVIIDCRQKQASLMDKLIDIEALEPALAALVARGKHRR